MIIAVVFAMVAALFVAPKAAYADEVNTVEYDKQAIIDATPTEAVISFPVVHESVYGNEIEWDVEEADKDIISYDEDAHWMVVNRLENENQSATVYLYINKQLAHTFEIKVPKGITFVPTYEIKYDYEVGDSAPTSYELGQASFDLPKPEKEGYTFGGWYTADENNTFDRVLVGSMEDLDLKAKWTVNQYTISFETGIDTILDSITKNFDAEIQAPAALERTGYEFKGWDLDGDNVVDTFPTNMPAYDITAKAVWEIKQFSITFDSDGGSVYSNTV